MPRTRNMFGELTPGYRYNRFSSMKEAVKAKAFLMAEHGLEENMMRIAELDIRERIIFDRDRTTILGISDCTFGLYYRADTDLFSFTTDNLDKLDKSIGPVSIKALINNDTNDSVDILKRQFPRLDPVETEQAINNFKQAVLKEA